ncbi:unnamed protein product, partial [Allacma fusca]
MEGKQQDVVSLVGSLGYEHKITEVMRVDIPETVINCDNKELQQVELPEKPGPEAGHCENLNGTRWNGTADSPLDLTIHPPKKRKLAESDLANYFPGTKIKESVKRNRPSVISFATRKSQQLENPSGANPEEHFLQALGPRVYNMIYGNSNAFSGTLQDARCSLVRTSISADGDPLVDEHFKKSLGEKTWMEVQVNDSSMFTVLWSLYLLSMNFTELLRRGETISCSNLEWARNHYTDAIRSLNSVRIEGGISLVDVVLDRADRCEETFRGEFTEEERYQLDVTEDARVEIRANNTAGALRALESLYQLLWPANDDYSLYNINVTQIVDLPRFSHRGIMLDSSRHYLPEKMIIKILTIMMYNKFNVFHWHVIDDQSFPYVSRKFPELSEKGAYSRRQVYTPETVSRIIDAARVRGIRVILEFDTPGHVNAIGRSHQEILTPCYGDGETPGTPNPPHHAAYENLDPTNELSYTFMREFFTEVVDTVPNITHIHLGMDEVYAPCWNSSPVIKEFMKQNGYTNLSQVQGHYTTRHVEMVRSLNVTPIAWQDPLDEGVE